MSRLILSSLLCATVAMPVMAQAQNAGDVLVMRRAIAQPTGQVTIPPSPDFVRVPLKVKDSGETTYALNGTLKLEVEEVGCRITDGSIIVDQDACAIGQGPRIGDIINFTAKMDPDLKAYYVSREQYGQILPAFSQQGIDALCSGTAVISGTEFSGSCDPAAVVNTYARYIYALNDPYGQQVVQNTASASELNFYIGNVGCMSTQTGSVVSDSNCNGISKSPNTGETHAMPATFVPELREVYLDEADVTGMNPPVAGILARSQSSFCTTPSIPTIRVDGQTWKVRCGEPESPGDYKRVVQSFYDPMNAGVARTPNVSDSGSLRLVVNSTLCFDTEGNSVSGKCDYLPEGPNLYDIVSIPATYVADLREVYVDWADIEEASGQANSLVANRIRDDACSGKYVTIKVDHQGIIGDWDFRCGTPDTPSNYTRTVIRFNDPTTFGAAANRVPNDATSNDLKLVVHSTGCLDSSGNNVLDKCDYLPEGPSVYDIVSVPATYVADLREVYVNRTDLEASAGNFGTYASSRPILGNSTLNDACKGRYFSLQATNGGPKTTWDFRCGTPDDPSNYTRTAHRLYDPITLGSDRTPNDSESGSLRMVVHSIGCLDKDGNSVADKCHYLPDGPAVYDILTIPATYVPELREVYVNREDVQAVSVNSNPILVNYYLNDACQGNKVTIGAMKDGSRLNWDFRCGPPDDPSKYEMRAQTLRDPRDYGDARSTNMDPNATELGLAVGGVLCVDKSTGTATTTSKCSYLSGNVKTQDILWMPAVFDAVAKTITIDPDVFRTLGHDTNLDYNHNSLMCARNITIDVNYQNFKVLCTS